MLRQDDRALHRRLVELRERLGAGGDIAGIRVWDIVCWMQATHPDQ